MKDKLWTKDINVLFKKERLLEFFPSKKLSHSENINAIVRFCLYSGMLLSFYKRNSIYLLTFLLVAIIISIASKPPPKKRAKIPQHTNPEKYKDADTLCTMPTKDNPMANFLMSDYELNPTRPEACSQVLYPDEFDKAMDSVDDPFDVFNTKFSERQFFSNANTKISNDQREFANWLYGNKTTNKEQALIKNGFNT